MNQIKTLESALGAARAQLNSIVEQEEEKVAQNDFWSSEDEFDRPMSILHRPFGAGPTKTDDVEMTDACKEPATAIFATGTFEFFTSVFIAEDIRNSR